MNIKLQLQRENHEDKVVIFANTSEGKEDILLITTKDKEMREQLAILICDLPNFRYGILGTSFSTGAKKWFEFNTEEWQEFKSKRWTHYPGWSFDDKTIKRFF